MVRLIDALARAEERAERLRAMHGGNLGWTLQYAAHAGLKDVRFLLAAGANAGAENGFALYIACCNGRLQVAEALLDAGDSLTLWHRLIVLLWAAEGGHTACCELLLARGANIHYGRDSALCQASCA